ncbi:GNAT family N-acetyltransferase [Microbacterium sp.]|uniref:GNAT family N-acetyltransferase n=1 Tax=Microbacterium sp. TaxID=51671 RepID=UPI0032427C62
MLDWHSATEKHRSHLSAFSCTLPDHGYFDDEEGFVCHDYPWELEVQDYVRSHKPPVHPPEFLLVGYDDVGLAAVLKMRVNRLDGYALIQAVAVAQRASGQGLASEAIAQAERVMRKYNLNDFVVAARIDPRNHAAKSAFTSAAYSYDRTEDGFDVWNRLWRP